MPRSRVQTTRRLIGACCKLHKEARAPSIEFHGSVSTRPPKLNRVIIFTYSETGVVSLEAVLPYCQSVRNDGSVGEYWRVPGDRDALAVRRFDAQVRGGHTRRPGGESRDVGRLVGHEGLDIKRQGRHQSELFQFHWY